MSRFWLKCSGVFIVLSLVFGLASIASAKHDLAKAGDGDESLRTELSNWALRVAESQGDGRFHFDFVLGEDTDLKGTGGAWLPVPCAGIEDILFSSPALKEARISAISSRIRVTESLDDKIHVNLIRKSKDCMEKAKKPRLHVTLNSGGQLKVELKENDDYAPGEVRELVVSIPKSNKLALGRKRQLSWTISVPEKYPSGTYFRLSLECRGIKTKGPSFWRISPNK